MLTNTPHFLDTTNPTTASTTATTTSSSNKVAQAGEFTKNMLAAAHGAGEKLRGEFNEGVDRTFNEVCDPPDPGFPLLGGKGMRSLACAEGGGV
jgi:hypothetical protein